ncbi:Subtilase family protein [Clostridium cavendishii DSM 21758]|uniref:Subtilase family protein n=1 Tax=Clostridium cavendishii DSM 21758 TaxID=1121302 RepID=A0A1M6DC58_9CLOT|nr:S8 family peptidase [Clostridium cavendishii]SHI70730.1 Subtilase family protein [Clostridium cavendishii DSM 21758]
MIYIYRIEPKPYVTVEYEGDIVGSAKKDGNTKAFIIDDKRAILEYEGEIKEITEKFSKEGVTINIIPNLTEHEFFALPQGTFATIEYQGDAIGAAKNIPNAKITLLDKKRAILSVVGDADDIQDVVNQLSDVILYSVQTVLHTTCDISPIEAAGATIFHNSVYLPLDGNGVVVGIVDTGIDYLNEEFINEDGTSRVLAIWDQINDTGKQPPDSFGGSEYSNEDINRAIQAKKNGEDPYKIVPSKDTDGHGTSMASIIGARGVNPDIIGVAPSCDLAIVKLYFAPDTIRDDFGVYGNRVAFSTSVVFSGIKYLYELGIRLKKPMVIFVGVGANIGPHNGLSFIERYIDEISKVRGIAAIVPTGNQGNSETHVSGKIIKKGDTKNIELKIGKGQINIKFEIWISKPDKFALSIISPSGEIIERIPPTLEKRVEVKFLYESTKIYVEYSIPEVLTGEERITIKGRNMREGIWIFKLIGELVISGEYDAYLIQRELLAPETKFLNSEPYETLTIPSTSSYAIAVGFYNQNNNSVVAQSGKGYTRDNRIKPDLVAGGINAMAATIGGATRMISGCSVATAIVAGCSALIFQWGIINGNDTNLYSTKLKTYLIGGTIKREGDIYPNRDFGYGILNMKGIFDNIRLKPTNFISRNYRDEEMIKYEIEYYIGKLFIRLPL